MESRRSNYYYTTTGAPARAKTAALKVNQRPARQATQRYLKKHRRIYQHSLPAKGANTDLHSDDEAGPVSEFEAVADPLADDDSAS